VPRDILRDRIVSRSFPVAPSMFEQLVLSPLDNLALGNAAKLNVTVEPCCGAFAKRDCALSFSLGLSASQDDFAAANVAPFKSLNLTPGRTPQKKLNARNGIIPVSFASASANSARTVSTLATCTSSRSTSGLSIRLTGFSFKYPFCWP
jgi:hypothetical protein